MDIIELLIMGGLAGVMAGLLGIGGGAIIVPVLVIMFDRQGIAPQSVMQLSIGTSLSTIVFTSLSSASAHYRRGSLDMGVFRRLAPAIVVGTLLGAAIADHLASRTLQWMFVVFLFCVAAQFSRGTTITDAHRQLPGPAGMNLAGLSIGTVSALFGIGGGSLTVPFLTWCSVPVKRAIGTSAAIGLPIALGGAVGYIVGGWNQPGLPPWTFGYVSLPAFAGIVAASTAAAPLGARLAHRLSETTLRRVFAVFVTVLGLHMLWGLLGL
ncbi:MAG: sulfite exporter TauE/SafE family protein [Arenicellales bacterium]